MAGDWIKMRGNLWDDPRVSRLCDLTDQSEAAIVGGLYWLWATADQHTEDGIMPGLTLRQIDRKTGIQGFGQALCDIGWLADHTEGVQVVDFEKHNGASAKKRCATAKRVANHRTGNDDVTQPALQNEQTSVSSALAREEKRREELIPPPTGGCPIDPSGQPDPEPPRVGKTPANPLPDCPYSRLLELWAKHLPNLTQPRVWEGNRKATMRCRWQQAAKPSSYSPKGYATEPEGVGWWDGFFGYIASETKLAEGFDSNGRTWKPDLEWVCNAANFQKIIDGKYAK